MKKIAKNQKNNRFIGVDPSLSGLAISIFNDKGELLEEYEFEDKKQDDPKRFMRMSDKVLELINPETDKVFIEGFSYNSKGSSSSRLYGLGWCLRIYFELNGVDWKEVPPTAVKKFGTGKGQIKKENMILPIFKKWKYESDSDNLRDSYILGKMCYSAYNDVELLVYEKEVLKKNKLI